jgi:hypothetical protein
VTRHRPKVTTTAQRLAALRDEGRELPVTRDDYLYSTPVGGVPGPEVRAVQDLARAIHRSESTACSVSWPAQEQARAYFNEHGLAATLDEARRLGTLALPGAIA